LFWEYYSRITRVDYCHYMQYHLEVKDEKLIQKFLTDQTHITVDDCDRLLRSESYEYHKSSGSHRSYHKKGDAPIIVIIPHHSKYVKPGYVQLIIKRLKLEEDDGN
jgi:predicted RNA binding protein YcfA (HicA-like mRNA interferase family)